MMITGSSESSQLKDKICDACVPQVSVFSRMGSRYFDHLAARQMSARSDSCSGYLSRLTMVIQVHEDILMCGCCVSADVANSKAWAAATATLQESWCPLNHSLSARVRVSRVSRHPHAAEPVPL